MTFDLRLFGANDFALAGGLEEADLELGVGGPIDRCPKVKGQRHLGWTGKVTHGCSRHFLWPWGYCGAASGFLGLGLAGCRHLTPPSSLALAEKPQRLDREE